MKKRGILYGMAAVILLAPLTFPFGGMAQTDEAFVLLSSNDVSSMGEAISFIEGEGGRIIHTFPYHVLIGHIPLPIAGEIIGKMNIIAVTYGKVDVSTVAEWGENAMKGARFWNYNLNPPPKPDQPPGTFPVDDTQLRQPSVMRLGVLTAGPPWGTAYGAGEFDTSEYMMGRVAVNVILVESTGNGENWSNPVPGACLPDCPREMEVTNEIIMGFNWWSDPARNPNSHLSWTWHFYYGRTDARAQTSYEPIQRPITDESLWIDEIMTNFGYSAAGYLNKVYEFTNDSRNTEKTDWALTIFVVDSYNDADGMFTDGAFAVTFPPGGPKVVLTYDNENWGISNMDFIAAHETGHVFYAFDEYHDPTHVRQCGDHRGYLDVQNQNYDLNGGNTGGCAMNDQNGIMREGASGPNYLANSTVSPYTRGQIGWGNVGSGGLSDPQIGDADQDGISDIIDFNPTIILNTYTPDPTTNLNPTYTGSASSTQTLHNGNPFDPGADITINKITQVQYRVDSGSWTDATATDGTFDEYNEDYTFTTSALSPGLHTIESRARNTAGNWSSLASDTLTISATYTITANASGNGTGTVTSDVGDINYTYPPTATGTTSAIVEGTSVILTATAGTGSNATWPDCATQGGTVGGTASVRTCTFGSLDSGKTVSAVFTLNTYTLTVVINPTGGGSVGGSGISCPGDCTETVVYNTDIVLTATPSIGHSFVNWTECDAPTGNVCTMTMTADKTATANFTLSPKKKMVPPSMLPMATSNILKGNDLLKQAQGLLFQAQEKKLDTSTCEKLIEEAKALMSRSEKSLANPIYANNLALQAIEKLGQTIECLKASLG